jgi:hypothetical protein
MAPKWGGAAMFKVAAPGNLGPLCTRLSVHLLRSLWAVVMPTVILKEGRVSVEVEAAVNLPDHRVLDRAVQVQAQAVTKRGRKLQRVLVVQVVLVVAVLKDLVRKRLLVLQPHANLCRVWLPSRGETLFASLDKGDREVQVQQLVRQDRGGLQSKVVAAQANPVVVALSRGSPVVRAVPRPKAMIGSLEALPRMSLVSVLQKLRAETVKLLDLKDLLVGVWEKVFSFVLMWRKSLLRQDFFPCSC